MHSTPAAASLSGNWCEMLNFHRTGNSWMVSKLSSSARQKHETVPGVRAATSLLLAHSWEYFRCRQRQANSWHVSIIALLPQVSCCQVPKNHSMCAAAWEQAMLGQRRPYNEQAGRFIAKDNPLWGPIVGPEAQKHGYVQLICHIAIQCAWAKKLSLLRAQSDICYQLEWRMIWKMQCLPFSPLIHNQEGL